jgi:hypothetical protein
MSNEETALNKAIHGYLRSAMYRRQGKKEPNRKLSTVGRADKPGGVTEFTITLRADDGVALRQFIYRLLPDGEWERGGDDAASGT